MTYWTQNDIANDQDLVVRVAQAAAQEGCADAGIDPDIWATEWRRVWASAPGWEQAWESALAGDVDDPGRDEGVITDAMILSQVQAMKPFVRLGAP